MKKILLIEIFIFLLGILILVILDERYNLDFKLWQIFIIGGLLFFISSFISVKYFKKGHKFMSDLKVQLIRDLAKRRVRKSGLFQGDEKELIKEINRMSEDELYSLPDSSIVDIVESYIKLKSLGLSDMEVFNEIEDLRSIIAGRGELPDHLTLNNYIKYRLSHDLGFLSVSFYARASFDDDFIDESIKEVLAFFQQK